MTIPSHLTAAQDTSSRNDRDKNLSRRTFLNSAGIAAAGGLVATASVGLVTKQNARASDVPEAPPLPWKYSELDPLEAGRRGYKNYLLEGG